MLRLRARLREDWRRFRARTPGERFSQTYLAHQRERSSATARIAIIVGAVLLVAVGVVALVAPGPGLIGIAAGLALIARESKTLANLMDRLELFGRRVWRRCRRDTG